MRGEDRIKHELREKIAFWVPNRLFLKELSRKYRVFLVKSVTTHDCKGLLVNGVGMGGIIDCGHFKGFIFNKGFISKMGGGRGEGETYTLD